MFDSCNDLHPSINMIEKQACCLTWAARFIVQKHIFIFKKRFISLVSWMLVEIFYYFHHFSIECNLGQCFKAFLKYIFPFSPMTGLKPLTLWYFKCSTTALPLLALTPVYNKLECHFWLGLIFVGSLEANHQPKGPPLWAQRYKTLFVCNLLIFVIS